MYLFIQTFHPYENMHTSIMAIESQTDDDDDTTTTMYPKSNSNY